MDNVTKKYTCLYKILPSAPPSPLPEVLPLSDLDKNDGYIHLSTHDQVPATASRFFTSFDQLWILKLKLNTFDAQSTGSTARGRIVWEESGSHGVFPHLYDGDLGSHVVDEVLDFKKASGTDWSDALRELPA